MCVSPPQTHLANKPSECCCHNIESCKANLNCKSVVYHELHLIPVASSSLSSSLLLALCNLSLFCCCYFTCTTFLLFLLSRSEFTFTEARTFLPPITINRVLLRMKINLLLSSFRNQFHWLSSKLCYFLFPSFHHFQSSLSSWEWKLMMVWDGNRKGKERRQKVHEKIRHIFLYLLCLSGKLIVLGSLEQCSLLHLALSEKKIITFWLGVGTGKEGQDEEGVLMRFNKGSAQVHYYSFYYHLFILVPFKILLLPDDDI